MSQSVSFPPLLIPHVHIWTADLDGPAERTDAFEATLSPDERQRASQFHFDRDRARFIAGRGILRQILGAYFQSDPALLRFTYNPRGKPALLDSLGRPFHFNLAHSDALMMIALTRVSPIGVDVEKIRAIDDAKDLARRFFSSVEIAQLERLPPDQHSTAFLNLWTRKEAILKATGEGIAQSLSQVEVSFLPGEKACVRSIAGNPQAAAGWTLEEFDPAAGFVAAVAAAATGLQFSYWRWPQ